nr:right-handed parallel beta-helix repeat-containing protein [Anaeromyxobacter dehalogenans]
MPLTVTGLHLNGGWDGVGTAGEWSHTISILGSRNVVIEGNELDSPYGDNVYLGKLPVPPHTNSARITIRRNAARSPRRCNIAVVAAQEVVIEDNYLEKTNGYVAAIDLEPNNDPRDRVSSVLIINNKVFAPKSPFVYAYTTSGYPFSIRGVTVDGNSGKARAAYAVGKPQTRVELQVVRNNHITP